jgi:hypothetical protein
MRLSSPVKFRKRGGTTVQSRTVRRQTEGTNGFSARIPRRSASLILARVQALNEFGEGRDTYVLLFE